ncbi:hypothetical protein IEO21_07860 [Rhodonia placenta]|uniref:Uncharacterized protein n=1 Tax=Rhodonia placenta TaxID=104341 RepID=A0A8H7NX97_9APHY|nr:hypothetical protein IEO21_07860 [Postia placenta]
MTVRRRSYPRHQLAASDLFRHLASTQTPRSLALEALTDPQLPEARRALVIAFCAYSRSDPQTLSYRPRYPR